MTTNMTPDKARELLDGTTPGPWQVRGDGPANRQLRVCDCEERAEVAESVTWEDAPLVAAAPALAQTVAGMHYEYAVATGPEHSPVYAAMNSQGRFIGTTLALADWWQTKGEAQDLVDELRGENEHSTARVVRRLVSAPEVVE